MDAFYVQGQLKSSIDVSAPKEGGFSYIKKSWTQGYLNPNAIEMKIYGADFYRTN
jgi:hypothetical protein